jgi:hypothetical protein
MNLVHVVKKNADQIRSRWFLSTLDRSELVYVQSCRIRVGRSGTVVKYRVTILVRTTSVVEAEEMVESHLAEIAPSWRSAPGDEPEIKKLKIRPFLNEFFKIESDTVVELLGQMRRRAVACVSSVDLVQNDLVDAECPTS